MTVVIDHDPRHARVPDRARPAPKASVVRFAGDSGDGIQLAGVQFARAAARGGAWLMTLPEFPAEIRAPAGTTFGVSAYQIQFGSGEVLTPGDEADMLVALNPAAFITNIAFLKRGGTVIVDDGAFNARGFAKAKIAEDPVDESAGAPYRAIRVDISKRTLEAVEACGVGRKDAMRARNFWALGLALWLADQPTVAGEEWISARFVDEPDIAATNAAALKAGHAYGETMELALSHPVAELDRAARPAAARMISGTDAMALGIAAVGALTGRPVTYCSYPITPASVLLHALARMPEGVRTFQAEDEIAAVTAAIGAAYAGAIGVSASSGPGISLKTEGLGLAVAAELPLIVIDVQRAGPSTGMPTKPEQSDLDMAIFGRHGEAPVAVLAPATGADCFQIMIDAARIATRAMTPVIVLSDAFLANAVSEWVPPDPDTLEPIGVAGTGDVAGRRPDTLTLDWVTPGTPGSERRVGGLEKDVQSGNISYDPDNHEAMVAMRAEKLARAVALTERPSLHNGPDEGELLVIGWGSTFGAVRQAVGNLRDAGRSVAHLHLRQLWPLPTGLGETFARYRRVAAVELNTGQLARILRAETLTPVEPVTQINGRPFRVDTVEHALARLLDGVRS
jgi:2-oxoglutarate ferredoxin oxidoreductase subunit alpha